MAARTRFGLEGYGVRRAGSFAGKTSSLTALDLTINPKWVGMALRRSFAAFGGRLHAGAALVRNFGWRAKP